MCHTLILTVLNCCTNQVNAIGSSFHSKYWKIFILLLLIFLQPRAIEALGVLCPHPALVFDQLIGNFLTILKLSLTATNSAVRFLFNLIYFYYLIYFNLFYSFIFILFIFYNTFSLFIIVFKKLN